MTYLPIYQFFGWRCALAASIHPCLFHHAAMDQLQANSRTPGLPPIDDSQVTAVAPPAPETTPEQDARQANRHRFELELEFVQSLANPHYLQSLAQQNVLSQPSFVLYLEYLLYWAEPEYARFIMCVAVHHTCAQRRWSSELI